MMIEYTLKLIISDELRKKFQKLTAEGQREFIHAAFSKLYQDKEQLDTIVKIFLKKINSTLFFSDPAVTIQLSQQDFDILTSNSSPLELLPDYEEPLYRTVQWPIK
jgi:hypothetical protein